MRIGLGYDIHRTGEGDHVWLGGVRVAAPFSLVGHSDADVLLHAITDAILGAIADYDIGHHFPPSDESNRGRPSSDFLRFALERMQQGGYLLTNIDCNIICELPRIAPVREEIRSSLAALMGIAVNQVSIKGRTNEKVDAIGEGRAVVCQAVVLLRASGESPL
ncbi:MAG: 2-C-methyl-D-erythritol 2,4-cyclodiphosphate synthase [Spirochaetota bacterium]